MTEPNGLSRVSSWVTIGAVICGLFIPVAYVGFLANTNAEGLRRMEERVNLQGNALTAARERINTLEVSMNEIETQFCGEDAARNLMHANDQRIQAMLWSKTFGVEYPVSNAYYPNICRRGSGK